MAIIDDGVYEWEEVYKDLIEYTEKYTFKNSDYKVVYEEIKTFKEFLYDYLHSHLYEHIELKENEEVDEPGMRTHGSVSLDSEKVEEQVDEEEEKRKKMQNVANKLDRLEQNQYENNEINNQPQVNGNNEPKHEDNLIDESKKGSKPQNVQKIDGEFDEQNLEEL